MKVRVRLGPASYYNDGQTRIAENYFIQIGQETGWLGLLLFLLINAGVGALLYVRRADPLALSLFAALIGLTFINLALARVGRRHLGLRLVGLGWCSYGTPLTNA